MAARGQLAYLGAAVPVRLVTEGASVALVLMAATRLNDLAVGAALIAVFTAPSVIAAPLIGALLDAVRSPRRAMLVSAVVLAGVLAVAAFAGTVPLPAVFAALVIGGCVLPVFLGGLSSFVREVMPGDVGRGFATDALAYNIAGIAGPGIVAGMSALLSATGALLALAVLALGGGLLLQRLHLPARGGATRPGDIARGIGRATRHLTTHGPLARAIGAGALVQLGAGALPVVAVLIAVARGTDRSGGGWLLTGYAIGGVTGALLVTVPAITRRLGALPPRVVMATAFAATGSFTLLAALVPGYAATLVALALSGLTDAPGIAAMLRIRQEESPDAVRAQVFIVGAGLRVAASALGAALVGLATSADPALLLALIALPWLASAPILLLGTCGRAVEPAT